MIKERYQYYDYAVVEGVLKHDSESFRISGHPVLSISLLAFSTREGRNDNHIVRIVNIAHRIALLVLAIVVITATRKDSCGLIGLNQIYPYLSLLLLLLLFLRLLEFEATKLAALKAANIIAKKPNVLKPLPVLDKSLFTSVLHMELAFEHKNEKLYLFEPFYLCHWLLHSPRFRWSGKISPKVSELSWQRAVLDRDPKPMIFFLLFVF